MNATSHIWEFLISEAALRDIAYGNGTNEKTISVIIGHVVCYILIAWVTLRGDILYDVRTMDRIRSVVNMALAILKVMFFVIIELLLFPLLCGILIDFVTIPLFFSPATSLTAAVISRIYFSCHAVITSIFLHWF